MAASRRQAIEQLQPQFARLPKGPIVDALLASDLTPTMDLHKFRSNFKGQGKKGFVSEDSLIMTYFVRPVSAFLASQTSPFPNWSFQTMHPYWTWPRDGSLPVLEGLIQFTEGSEGPPGMAHGGCVATALDSVATCLVNSMFSRMHMPQEPKPGDPVFEHPGYRTVSLTVGYSKGTPVGSTFYYRILVEKADDGKGKDGKLQLRRKLRIKGGIYERILAEGESDASAKPALVADFDGVFVLGGAVPLNVFEESWKVLESEGRAKAKL